MRIIKAWCHLKAVFKKLFYQLLYRGRIKFGYGVTWRRNFSIMIDTNAEVIIGDECFFNNECTLDANIRIQIGSGTILGENVKVYDHNHVFTDVNKTIKEQGYVNKPVVIGSHCWIGSNVVILAGAQIGDNCVIGAGSVIKGKIPNDCIAKSSGKVEIKEIVS